MDLRPHILVFLLGFGTAMLGVYTDYVLSEVSREAPADHHQRHAPVSRAYYALAPSSPPGNKNARTRPPPATPDLLATVNYLGGKRL